MKAYTADSNKGRTVGVDDIHHKTVRWGTKKAANASAKSQRHAARQDGKRQASHNILEKNT
jgi:hypothetical protein